jgi:sulfofructosephosphate aldolase
MFSEQLDAAGRAGASGFLAGRAIWSDALGSVPAETDRLAREISLPRLRALREVARRACRPLAVADPGDRQGA